MKKFLIIPTYLPSIVTMSYIVQSPTLLFEVNDNYQKQSFRNRTYINTANGKLGLTIPIKHNKTSGHKKTHEAAIENNFLWQRQHWRSIQIAYRYSPFFEFYENDMDILFTKTYTSLLEFNITGVEILLEMLNIEKTFEKTVAYEKEPNDVYD
ncbi:MAG: WbqC family protein, partial [Leeuwenhoekiella sp.]